MFSFNYRCSMSTKHIRTTADVVRFGASVRIECRGCGAARTMSGMEFAQSCGSGPLAAARARLRCARCGEKEAKVTVLSPL